jgi:hypothetical protein
MKTNRAPEEIKQDMLEWAKENIYERMGEEWDYQKRDFDPLVHLLVGSLASEIKNIYDAIDGSEQRIVKKLAELIVPQEAHLPFPARALASVAPTGSTATLSEMNHFRCDTENGGSFYFTPAFNCTILNSQLKVVGSDGSIFEYKPGKERPGGQQSSVSILLLGLEAPKPITSFDNVLVYFNLLGSNKSLFFLNALAEGKWRVNGQPVNVTRGFGKEANSEDEATFIDRKKVLNNVAEVYTPYFFTVKEYLDNAQSKRNISDVVVSWLRDNHTDSPSLEEQAQALSPVEDNFFWIEIQLPYAIRVSDFEKNFRCATNIVPVVNRKLCYKDDADTFINRPLIDAICLSPAQPFLGIHEVENLQNKELIPPVPFHNLKSSKNAAYSLRYGGVGRLDNYNTWKRLSYLLGLFREEHRYREVLDRIGDKISLEELHLLVGDKVLREQGADEKQEKPLYLFLHPGTSLKAGIRVRISYWTTDGGSCRGISLPKNLVCDPANANLRKDGISLITEPTGGRNAPDDTDYFGLIRDNLLNPRKIVTSQDVKNFCRRYVGKSLREVRLQTGFRVDPRPSGNVERVSEVVLCMEEGVNIDKVEISNELEYMLNERSSGIIPFTVTFTTNNHE